MATVQALGSDKPTTTPGTSPASLGRLRLRVPGPPAFLPLQRPKLVAKPPSGEGRLHEIKLDGYRMQLDVRRREATWWSRNGNDWTDRLTDLGSLAAELPAGVYDGEVCALNVAGEPDFSARRSFMGSRQTGRIVFFAFDLLRDRSGDLRPQARRERKARLCAAVEPSRAARSNRIRYVGAPPGLDGPALFAAATAMGLEGIVSKRLDAPYTGGARRLDTWLKAKSRPSQEVVVGGWETDGERFTALMVGVHEGEALPYVGHVGTGFSAGHGGLAPRAPAAAADRPLPLQRWPAPVAAPALGST